jgi:hypothetical protein
LNPKHLHIVSLDVPFPPDYGGAIDIFFRIQALHQLGYRITLHCFEYGRGQRHEVLEQCVDEVHYYLRKKPLLAWFSKIPFIVNTRRSKELLQRLLSDQDPILFEGLHTTFFLPHPELKGRIKIVRSHNVEHEYYSELGQRAHGKERMFFHSEARKLRAYEKVLKHASHILAIQENDQLHFREFHPSVHLLPASLPHIRIHDSGATEKYCLFHGNLSVAENEHAALALINTFGAAKMKLVIAGKNPGNALREACAQAHVALHANPGQEEMETLIVHAHVHTLFTEQPTGLKLKLLSALSTRGHVLVNPMMVAGSSLGQFCVQTESIEDFATEARRLLQTPVDAALLEERHQYLQTHFDTAKNCQIFETLLTS